MFRIGYTRAALALFGLLIMNGSALADHNNVHSIVEGLTEFSIRVDELATFGLLDDPLPLMTLSPVGDDGLRLAQLFEDSLNVALGGTINTLPELQAAIDNADDDDVGGVSITFEDVVVEQNADLIDVSFTVVATRMDVLSPISFSDLASINFEGGGIELDLSLSVSLSFQLDTNEIDPTKAFYLSAVPSVEISVDATGEITGFSDIVGIGDVSITGTAMLDLDLGVDFLDPDDDGRLTVDEWMNTSFADLVEVVFREEEGDEIVITLSIDSALVGEEGSVDATIVLTDNCLGSCPNKADNGLDLPVVDLGCLGNFVNVSPSEILSGLSLLACTVNATEAVNDIHLPFLQKSLGDTLDLGQPLADFLKQQIEVAFTCGMIDDDPPRGDIVDLAIGDVFYCQATRLENPVSVTWLSSDTTKNVDVVSGGSDLTTLGANPTTNVTLTMTADGRPDVRLEFVNSDGETRYASRSFLTAEELLEKLKDLGGFDADIILDYDCKTSSLTVQLVATVAMLPEVEVELDFSDRLQSVANLANLGATATGSAKVTPQDIMLNLTFGVILVEDIADITPGKDQPPPEEFDRFFIKPSKGGHEFEASAIIEATIDLTGTIGFLGVTVVGDPDAPFQIGAIGNSPMLAVDINTPENGVPIKGTDGISGAILVGDLLEDPLAWTDPTFSIQVSGGLKVDASATDPAIETSGTIGIDWADASTGEPIVSFGGDFATLMLFDTDPSVYGSHTGADGSDDLIDTTQDFSALPTTVGRTLRNLTDGSTCLVTGTIGNNTLICALTAGTDNDWDMGDEYQLEGNALDMLSVILDGLDLLVQGIDALTGDRMCDGTSDPCSVNSDCDPGVECLISDSALNTELPLVGVSPEDLLGFLDGLESALDEIRTGEPDAQIFCKWTGPDGGPPDNDGMDGPDQPADNLVGLPPGSEVECQAIAEAEPATVSWTIIDLATDFSSPADMNADSTGTVGPAKPAEFAKFVITDGGSIGRDFQIRVDFSYPDSGAHSAELAEGAFTLQVLEELIEDKLGIPPEALKLELADLPAPGGTGPDLIFDLVLRLGFGVCTTGNSNINCSTDDRMVEQPGIRLSLPLEDLLTDVPGLVGLDAEDPEFKLEYRARAQLDLAIPLTFNETGDAVVVVDSSGVTVEVAAMADNLAIMASIGPLMLNLGGEAKIGATFSLAPSTNDETFTIEGYFDNLTATIEGPQSALMCGSLIVPLVVEGTHQGAGPMDDGVNDPGEFGNIEIGATLHNLTSVEQCVVTHKVGDHTLKCLDPDDNDNPIVTWDSGDEYEVVDLSDSTDLNGDACANFSLQVIRGSGDPVDVGFLGFVAPDITDPDGTEPDAPGPWVAKLSGDLLGSLNLECLAFDLLLEGLSFVVEQLTDVLEGGGPKLDLPILGDRLDGGSGLCSSLGEGEEGLLFVLAGLAAELDDIENATAGLIKDRIQSYIFDAVTGLGLLKDIIPLEVEGTHTGANDAEVLFDTGKFVEVNAGATVLKVSSGEECTAAIVTDDTIRCENDDGGNVPFLWDANDMYTVIDHTVDQGDVEVTIKCGAGDCLDPAPICEIDDIQVRFLMGQGVVGDDPGCTGDENDCPPGATDLPFNLGLPGVPLAITGFLEARVGWQYMVDFGLSRTDGPYLVASGTGHEEDSDEAELTIAASVGLLGIPGTCDPEDTMIPALEQGYDTGACVVGSIAFLETIIRDGNGMGPVPGVDRTEIALLTKLNIVSGNDRIGFSQLADGDLGLVLSIEANANADLRFRTRMTDASAKLPSVLGTFQLEWAIASFDLSTTDGTRLEFNDTPQELSFNNLYLDVGGFFEDFLEPMLEDVSKALKPAKPVIDTLRAPVPLVSDLSQLVGGPKVTLFNLLELANGAPLPMIENIIALAEFLIVIADGHPGGIFGLGVAPDGTTLIGGSFDINAVAASMGPQTPDKAGQLVEEGNGGPGIQSSIMTGSEPGSLSFPFLEDSSQIFGLLMGQDVTLLRYDFGEMKAVATLGPFTYCCIPVGPVPVGVFIEGSATLSGRFAMGYDTVGLRKAFARKQFDEDVLVDVIDGVFIDDLDAQGCDVPEISLKGEVRAGAGVDIGFAAAGVDGGVTFTVDLNLDDRPDPDGKLRIDEVVDRISNPICLFDVSGRLEAFLGAWVRVGFEWFSKSWRFDILRITLLEFSAACAPPSPAPATPVGGHLEVNIGEDRSGRRRFNVGETEEDVVVRQLNIEGTRFSVALMGFIDEYDIDLDPSTGYIDIQGGSDDDVISLLPGVVRMATAAECESPGEVLGMCNISEDPCTSDADCRATGDTCNIRTTDVECIIPFTRRAEISGGAGADQITSGGGDDILYGGDADTCSNGGNDGNDKISGGDGDDVIHGCAGDDVLDGGAGNDTIFGEDDNDVLSGGPDTCHCDADDAACIADKCRDGFGDTLDGGAGSDDLNGGPGINTAEKPEPSGDADPDVNRFDGNDKIVGGPGPDTIQGFFGNDTLYGDEVLTCDANGAAPGGIDRVDGGPGDDELFGGNNDDVLGGEEGNDLLCGNGGNDMLDGDDLEDSTPDGDDRLFGGPGEDQLFGRGGHDALNGDADNDALYGGAGPDDLIGGGGRDILFGDIGIDILLGDNGSIAAHDATHTDSNILSAITRDDGDAVGVIVDKCVVTLDFGGQPVLLGVGNSDCLFGEDESDFLFGEEGDDRMFGDGAEGECNEMFGSPHQDYMEGNSGKDVMRGGIDDDEMYGNDDNDQMFGDSGEDRMFGGKHDDLMRGGKGDDYMEGNEDGDTMFGDAGQDDMIGGSSTAATPDGDDTMFGNAEQDVMVGDNATIERPDCTDNADCIESADGTVIRIVTLLDLACTPASVGGADTMNGNAGNDDMYGGCDNDIMHGDQGDDHIEGNPGDDEMYGDLGQDDMIGGTGRTKSDDDSTAQDGRLDGDDEMYGGDSVSDLPDDYDVLVGDNATIDRPLDDNGEWIINTFNSAVKRKVTLLDVATVTDSADANASGDDFIYGEGNDDILFGQGDDDFMFGGTGEDYMEGNAGNDDMEGNAGNDDMVGGTGRINDDGPNGTAGRLDGVDTMNGNTGFDVMAGDNAILVRVLVEGQWVTNTFNDGIQHEPRILLDLDSPATVLVSAGDFMYGDEKDDLMYGQGGDDFMQGNDDEDFMEGNAGVDTMEGNAGQDDMIGGTVQAGLTDEGDIMSGNGEDDVMIGDNGTITRPLDPEGAWRDDLNTGGRIRDVVLFDVQTVGANIDPHYSGDDKMYGDNPMEGNDDEDGDDQMFGQGGEDEMHGGSGFDYMEGNHADDEMHGDAGEDDMIGGGSANDGVISRTSIGNGLLDGEDEMFGGDEGDVMSGDNSRIVRATDDDGIWQVDPNSDDVFREVVLFDVETVEGPAVHEDTSGSDLMLGEDGRDLMFGQGNTQVDHDGDGRFNEDPPDGLDNDRDGREGPDSEVYDCADCSDNDDGDGAQDADDEQCTASIDEDGGGDEMHGGDGPDYMEGNHGSDWMLGDAAEDDMIGGSSAGDGVIGGGVPPTDLLDGDDTMTGGDEDDVMIGDNGTIVRSTDGDGIWLRHNSGPEPDDFDIVVRVVTMDEAPESDGAFGHDHMRGQAGHDDLYGQLGNDVMEGNDGEDAMLGDLGRITGNIEDGSRQRIIMPPGPFFEELIFEAGTYYRLAELFSFEDGENGGGNDVMLGGDGRDSLHGGPGDDIINGDGGRYCAAPADDPNPETDDEDHLFGGDGDDVMWGGRGHDHLWGGHHEDVLDVRPRVASEVTLDDSPEWFTYGEPDHYQALDLIYGGWDRDAMQANVAEPGPPPADRLIDWAGGFNVFYVCPGAYGEGTITRQGSPHLREFLRDLAEADGALMPHVAGTSGFRELGYVFPNQRRHNSHPPHDDHPGHFVCDDGEVLFNEDVGGGP